MTVILENDNDKLPMIDVDHWQLTMVMTNENERLTLVNSDSRIYWTILGPTFLFSKKNFAYWPPACARLTSVYSWHPCSVILMVLSDAPSYGDYNYWQHTHSRVYKKDLLHWFGAWLQLLCRSKEMGLAGHTNGKPFRRVAFIVNYRRWFDTKAAEGY